MVKSELHPNCPGDAPAGELQQTAAAAAAAKAPSD